ncbi:MAG: fused DSP-PTPase phosphatase/NAD kinase-like protein [Burkholderiaceae bacterium]
MTYDLTTASGRWRAHLNMLWTDHGWVRALLDNCYALPGGMWRSSQPSPAQIRRLHVQHGIKTIINLRGAHLRGSYGLEQAVCAELGIVMIDHSMQSGDMPSTAQVLALQSLFERITYPALMHCKSGADRAGLAASLYRHLHCGEAIADQRELGLKYAHFKASKAGILDYFLACYLAHNAREPMDFLTWLHTRYDREALTAQYKAGEPAHRVTDTLLEKVLRRE